jgi:hypothetical protein
MEVVVDQVNLEFLEVVLLQEEVLYMELEQEVVVDVQTLQMLQYKLVLVVQLVLIQLVVEVLLVQLVQLLQQEQQAQQDLV